MKAAVRSNPWFSVLLALITLMVLYFFNDHQSPIQQTHKRPQEYMKRIVMHDFTETGSLKQTLEADTWAYRPEKQQSILEKPHLTVYKTEGLWKIQAEHGLITQPNLGKITLITLQHHVRLERPPTEQLTALRLETSMLQYEPKTDTAHSDAFVIIKKPGLQISGWGLDASFHPESLALRKDVHTTYHSNY
ncbi:MAG: LPS export ABC transporter periplasmic protein LptC [Gammaproteobacteria bacterium]|nr:LPS export ABC transporter periplasmic protein LptC [Gammaproteobacteria bacterium]MBP9729120.1 LPS export ABC transporter periplasmic protein LptC [Gammaproteobacteria bacterium]